MQKPHILIVSDYPGWAYDHVSDAIMHHLTPFFTFSRMHAVNLPLVNHREFDLVYVMYWRTDFLERNPIPKRKLIIQVSSFWSWQQKYRLSATELAEGYLNRAIAVSVNCPGLYDLIEPHHTNVFLNPSGVDLALFPPQPPRPADAEGSLVVGWTGSVGEHGDNKGLLDFIRPACEALSNVTLNTITREDDWLPHEQMPNFYREIDVYLSASQSEGTPNPALEAAASARAVVSTPVGIVPMLIDDGYNGFIIPRTVDAIQNALRTLRDQRDYCIQMGQNNRKVIESEGWDWQYRAGNYKRMFDKVLSGRSYKNFVG